MAQINQVRAPDRESPLDIVMKGLSIASTVYGLKSKADEEEREAEKFQMAKEDRDTKLGREEDYRAGKRTKGELFDVQTTKGYEPAQAGDAGALASEDPETGLVSYVKKAQKPVIGTPGLAPKVVGGELIGQDAATGKWGPLYKSAKSGGFGAAGGRPYEYVDPEGNKRRAVTGSQRPDSDPITVPKEYSTEGVAGRKLEEATKVTGLAPVPGRKPSVKDAEDVKVGLENYNNLMSSLNRLDTLYQKSGTNLVGDDAIAQEGLVTDIQLNLKEMVRLGVLNGPDLALLQKMVPDPTTGVENIKGSFGFSRYGEKAAQFRQTLDEKMENKIKARGYVRESPEDAPAPKGDGSAKAPPSGSDPTTAEYARVHSLDYEAAAKILAGRGHKPQ